MKTNGNDKALESYKIFPYIAWALTFGFAIFVYNITTELQSVATNLQQQTQWLQAQINNPQGAEADFTAPSSTE